MPSSDWTTQSAIDYHFNRAIVRKQLKFSLFPRRCYISGRRIWLEKAYCITASYREIDNYFVNEHRWYSVDAYLVATLKNLI